MRGSVRSRAGELPEVGVSAEINRSTGNTPSRAPSSRRRGSSHLRGAARARRSTRGPGKRAPALWATWDVLSLVASGRGASTWRSPVARRRRRGDRRPAARGRLPRGRRLPLAARGGGGGARAAARTSSARRSLVTATRPLVDQNLRPGRRRGARRGRARQRANAARARGADARGEAGRARRGAGACVGAPVDALPGPLLGAGGRRCDRPRRSVSDSTRSSSSRRRAAASRAAEAHDGSSRSSTCPGSISWRRSGSAAAASRQPRGRARSRTSRTGPRAPSLTWSLLDIPAIRARARVRRRADYAAALARRDEVVLAVAGQLARATAVSKGRCASRSRRRRRSRRRAPPSSRRVARYQSGPLARGRRRRRPAACSRRRRSTTPSPASRSAARSCSSRARRRPRARSSRSRERPGEVADHVARSLRAAAPADDPRPRDRHPRRRGARRSGARRPTSSRASACPVVYVVQPYGGMSPTQMEGQLVGYYEYHFLYVNGIEHIESQSIQGMAMLKLYFHPGTDIAQSLAQVDGDGVPRDVVHAAGDDPAVHRALRRRLGSGRPARLLERHPRAAAEVQDLALYKVRPAPRDPARRLGAAALGRQGPHDRRLRRSGPASLLRPVDRRRRDGDRARQPDAARRQRARRRHHDDRATERHGRRRPRSSSGSRCAPAPAPRCCLRDVGARRGQRRRRLERRARERPRHRLHADHQAPGRLDARRRRRASRQALPRMRAQVPDDVHIDFEFDQSVFVKNAIRGLATEGALGAVLTALDGAALPARLALGAHRGAHHPALDPLGRSSRCASPGRRSTS